MKERNKAVPAVYVLLERERGEILLIKRLNTGYQDGNWSLPSGHIEAGELPIRALIREAREEVGIELSWYDLKLVHVSYRPRHDETGDRVDFFFKARRYKGTIRNCEPHKCAGIMWASPEKFPSNIAPVTLHAILCVRNKIVFSEIDVNFLRSHGLYKLGT